MFKLPQKIKNDVSIFEENLKKFLSGEITSAFFKGVRVPWGNYSQRGGKVFMSRLRVPSGTLKAEQLRAIGEAAKKFAEGKLHITTRQDIQIHNVQPHNSIKIIKFLHNFDISPRGGGGNTVRNIMGCYLSGICPYEKIKVCRYVWGLSEYLLSLDQSYNLPRKFKISFSGCEKDCAGAGVNDVGFIATDGKFKVICGGGMGAKSSVGKILEEGIEPDETGYIARAVENVFNKYGDRRNKHHNRLRFLIQDIGWEKFYQLYREELKRLRESEYIVLRTENGFPELKEKEYSYEIPEELKYNIGKQKQKGYYYFQIRIPMGEINSEQLIELSKISEEIPEVIFRTTQRQNLVVSNIPGDKVPFVLEKVKELFQNYLFPETVFDIVSCKAATTCNLGICNAIAMTPEIEKELKKLKIDIEKFKDIRININGCPNACGQHPVGTISLSGLARKVYNRTVPFYRVYFGGKLDAERTKLAEDLGIVPARAIPKLISEFISSGKITKDSLKELIKKYSYVPPYEEDRSFYIDFGKTEEFSLEGISQGECGAGVIDMIEADLESAKQSLTKAEEKELDLEEIKNALVYSARALLVVKGIDPKDDIEAINSFIEKFIKQGISRPEFERIKDVYQKIIEGKIQKQEAYDFTKKFYNEVKEIYSLMDPQFNFPVRFKKEKEESEEEERKNIYDLRGTPCPLNYVKAKLRLEQMNSGEILEIYLDDGEPIRSVPKSLESDGQEILKIEKEGEFYKVIVKKKN